MKEWYLIKEINTPRYKVLPQKLKTDKLGFYRVDTDTGRAGAYYTEEELKKYPSWFRCEVDGWRLPEDIDTSDLVWLYNELGNVFIGRWNFPGWYHPNDTKVIIDVKYWKPIDKPEPPKL